MNSDEIKMVSMDTMMAMIIGVKKFISFEEYFQEISTLDYLFEPDLDWGQDENEMGNRLYQLNDQACKGTRWQGWNWNPRRVPMIHFDLENVDVTFGGFIKACEVWANEVRKFDSGSNVAKYSIPEIDSMVKKVKDSPFIEEYLQAKYI